MTNRRAGSYGLLANIPDPPSGPWKFWKNAEDPRFPQRRGYTELEPICPFADNAGGLAARHAALSAGSNFSVSAYESAAGTWTTSDGGVFIEHADQSWRPYKHCETLGFASNCSLTDAGELTVPSMSWLKPQAGDGFDPAIGRPYSGQGGLNKGGVVADETTWWVNPSRIKGGNWTPDSGGTVSGTDYRWRWLGSPREQVFDTYAYGPYPSKFLCAVCWKPVAGGWEAFPLNWRAGASAPDGWDLAAIGPKVLEQLGEDFVGIRFDLRAHCVTWGVLPARNANEVHSGPALLTHDSAIFESVPGSPIQRPDNLYFNTQIWLTVRVVAAVAI